MVNYSIVRFGDSVNNVITGPSVSNWDLLTKQGEMGILGDTYFVTYTEKFKGKRYPKDLKIQEVSLEQSKEVSSRMPLQPHFNSVNEALKIVPKLKKKVVVVAVSGRYSPQAEQFCSILRSNYGRKCKLIVEGHGSDVCGYQLRSFEDLYKNLYKKADLVILEETPFAKMLFDKEKFPTKNMVVCPTVVLWEYIIGELKRDVRVLKDIKERYYRRYKIPKGSEFILTIGRFQPEKGHREFVIAAKKLLKDYPNLYFLLGGSGDGTIDQVKKLIGKEKRIKIIGKVPFSDFYPLIANSLAFVASSFEIWKKGEIYFGETGPRTVVDALAAGILGKNVVIASDSGGTAWKFNMEKWFEKCSKLGCRTPSKPRFRNISKNKNVMVCNANNRGLLVEQKNPDSIAEAIRIVVDNKKLAKKINMEGRKYVRKWYSSKKISLNYNRLIKNSF